MRRGRLACAVAVLAGLAGCGGTAHPLLSTEPGVSAVALADHEVWIGHKTLGLLRLPATGGAAEVFGDAAGLAGPRREVRSVVVEGDNVWVATAGGVARFSRRDRKVAAGWTAKDGLGGDSVRCVAVARGRTWAGTIFGASRLLPGGKRWKNYQVGQGLSQNHVYRLLDDGHDLWASCINGGLARFDERLDRWVAVPQDHGIGNKYTYAMALDGTDGSFWLGTAGGVNRYDPHRGWDVVVCESGFTDYSVYAIHRSGDTLWFGTTYGLYRRDLKAGTQRVLGRAAGLPGDDVVALAASPDILYVATRTGVSTIPLR